MGTQKNRLNETVLLSTQNICLTLWVRKYLQFYTEMFCLSKPVLTTRPNAYPGGRKEHTVERRRVTSRRMSHGINSFRKILSINPRRHTIAMSTTWFRKDPVQTDYIYSFINGKSCESSGVSVLKRDGISQSYPKEKSSTLNEQFWSTFTKETKEDLNTMPSMSGSPYPKMRSFTINNRGVLKLLKN